MVRRARLSSLDALPWRQYVGLGLCINHDIQKDLDEAKAAREKMQAIIARWKARRETECLDLK